MTGIAVEHERLGRVLNRLIVGMLLVAVGVLGGLGLARLGPRTDAASLTGTTRSVLGVPSPEQAYRIHQASERDFALPLSPEQAYRIHQASERATPTP